MSCGDEWLEILMSVICIIMYKYYMLVFMILISFVGGNWEEVGERVLNKISEFKY